MRSIDIDNGTYPMNYKSKNAAVWKWKKTFKKCYTYNWLQITNKINVHEMKYSGGFLAYTGFILVNYLIIFISRLSFMIVNINTTIKTI